MTWLQPYPDAWLLEQAPDRAPGPEVRSQARETVELAFIAALQRLPPRQTAALLLCDVLSFSAAEAAGMLETSPTAIKGVLQRARASLTHQRGRTNQGDPPRAGSAVEQDLARRFAIAFVEDDIDGVLALLTDNAWLAMPPAPHEYYGPEAIASFLRASAGWRRPRQLRLVPTRANTQPAFGCYVTDPTGQWPTPPACWSSPCPKTGSEASRASSTGACPACSDLPTRSTNETQPAGAGTGLGGRVVSNL